LASYIVTTIADENDSGASVDTPLGTGLSLREAITLANANPGADTIAFADGFGEAFENGGTIYLTQGTQLETTGDVTIDGDVDGDGKGDVTIDANSAVGQDDATSRVLLVSAGTARIDGLTITAGYAVNGGGIYVDSGAALELTSSTVSDNEAVVKGGGLYNSGTMTVTDSTVSGNYTAIEAVGSTTAA
jgi:hypothetical protein